MPMVAFETLPDDARVWVFASDAELNADQRERLLTEVDAFLGQWNAHGMPLRCARDLREGRFLAIGVDQSTAGASGCSIDGLFRLFKSIAPTLGASLLTGGLVHWRDADGVVRSATRKVFSEVAATGDVGVSSPVFDTSVGTAGAWRDGFEKPAGDSWHSALIGPAAAGKSR